MVAQTHEIGADLTHDGDGLDENRDNEDFEENNNQAGF